MTIARAHRPCDLLRLGRNRPGEAGTQTGHSSGGTDRLKPGLQREPERQQSRGNPNAANDLNQIRPQIAAIRFKPAIHCQPFVTPDQSM